MTSLERRIYEVRRLVGFTALIYELSCDGGFTVRFTAPDGKSGRVRMTKSEPRIVAAVVAAALGQPGQQGGP
jgi:hypothetical protein